MSLLLRNDIIFVNLAGRVFTGRSAGGIIGGIRLRALFSRDTRSSAVSNIKLFGNTGSAHAARRPRRGRRAVKIIAAVLALLAGLYCLCVFSDIPFIAKWRTIYIQTAMDTMNHQWLATAVIPRGVIDEAMAERAAAIEEQGKHSSAWDWADGVQALGAVETEEEFYKLFWEIDRESMEGYLAANPDALEGGWGSLYINEAGLGDSGTSIKTSMGEQVLAVDVPNQVLLLRVSGTGYRGVLAVAKDPSRLSVQNSAYLGQIGQYAGTIAGAHGGVLAMTGSAFADEGGVAHGGTLSGWAMADGVPSGEHLGWGCKRMELREDDCFYIVDASAPVDPATTDAVEFTPAIIVDGEQLNTDGWNSLQPRAVMGQSGRGEILMLVVEGRFADSIGVSVAECGEILLRHECMQAMNLDGGTSAILWYDGEYVTRCSNPDCPEGRELPNAFVYARAGA